MNRGDFECQFVPSERDETLRDLALRYHFLCEEYDRTVCTGPVTRGGAMPADLHERRLITRNAHTVLARIQVEAENKGITRKELLRAIGKYSNETLDNPAKSD